MLSYDDYCFLQRLAAHETGHSICGLTMGKMLGRITIKKDANGRITGGQSDFGYAEKVTNPTDAWRDAVCLYAGHVGEKLICRPEIIADETYTGPESDRFQLVRLADLFGGEDPVAWSLSAEARAKEILVHYSNAHRELYQRIVQNFEYTSGPFEIDWLSGPLAHIRFNATFAEPLLLQPTVAGPTVVLDS